MKKLILLISILFLVVNLSGAKIIEVPEAVGGVGFIAGGTPVVGGCNDTLKDSQTGATGSNIQVTYSSAQKYISSRFLAGSDYTKCKTTLRMFKTGSPTANYYVMIYTDVTGGSPDPKPGTQVGGTSNALDSSSVGGTEEDVTFDGLSSSLTNGDYYWIVVYGDFTPDGVNYLSWARGPYNAAEYMYMSSDGSTWVLKSNGQGKFSSYD